MYVTLIHCKKYNNCRKPSCNTKPFSAVRYIWFGASEISNHRDYNVMMFYDIINSHDIKFGTSENF